MRSSQTLIELAKHLAERKTTSRALVEACLERIADPASEGARAYVKLYATQARASADAYDVMRAQGYAPSVFAGIPISVKDLFDISGDVTLAGSRVLHDQPVARADAVAIAHLRQAGFIILGRTQMTEFAFSGVGLNPHFEAPSSLWDRASQRVPGGSSSGAALSVADGMAYGAIGTDTGGSCRIPAAFNGVVGFKPTASRINKQGAFPLSPSLDSIGPLANSVACCAELDGVMSGHRPSLAASSLAGARIFIPRTMVFDGIDADVAAGFERVCALLRAQGALVHEMDVPEYQTIQQLNAKGGFAAAEAFHIHKAFIADKAQLYDPRVLSRIRRGQEQTAADYIALLEGRAAVISAYQQRLAGFDFCLYPTVPVIAPPKAAFASDEDYARLNLLLLRNPALINMLDGCAISIPVHQHGAPPQGVMLSAMGGQDAQLLNWALAVEEVLAPHRHS